MRIFEGLKVLDFSWGAALPLVTKALSDHGATVVRVETALRPGIARTLPPFKDASPGIDQSALFAIYNTGKLSLTLNLKRPEAQDIARRLVAWADVVTESFSPGVMARWRLSYDDLVVKKPDLLMVSSTMLGQTGPLREFAGFGTSGSALAGFVHLMGWPDRPPANPYGAYTDYVVPRLTLSVLLAALDHRERTGEGMHIDFSQIEAAMLFLGPSFLDYATNGRVSLRSGNRVEGAAPHGVYPCRGDDSWVAVAVLEDQQWRSLCGAMQQQSLSDSPLFIDLAHRKQNEDELDDILSTWTRGHSREDVVTTLQAVGVPSGPVETCADLRGDPQLEARGFFVTNDHPTLGPFAYEGFEYIMSETTGEIENSPLMGQHTHAVLKDILELSDSAIADLASTGALE